MAIHSLQYSSWRILQTEEPCGLLLTGSQSVGHNLMKSKIEDDYSLVCCMVRCFSVLLLRMSIIPAPEWITSHKNKWSSSVCPQQCGGYVCSVSSHYSQWGGYRAHFILDKRRMQSAKKHILDTRSWKWGKGRFLFGLSDSQNNTLQHWDCNFSYFSEKSIGLFFGRELEREEMRWRNTEI